MAYWYAVDVIKVEPVNDSSELMSVDATKRIFPMLIIETSETWKITHIQSGTVRNVTFGDVKKAWSGEFSVAYEEDNPEPEVALIRTEEEIPQSVLDECNAVGPGGQFVVKIDTVAKRNALYATYPSLEGRFADQ
jgi:protein subunit release factor B